MDCSTPHHIGHLFGRRGVDFYYFLLIIDAPKLLLKISIEDDISQLIYPISLVSFTIASKEKE